MQKTCDTCEYQHCNAFTLPCLTCSDHDRTPTNWQPKEAPMEKTCLTCEYTLHSAFTPPCLSCLDHDRTPPNWTPKKEAPLPKTKIEIIRPVTIASVAAEGLLYSQIYEVVEEFAGYETTTPIHECKLTSALKRRSCWKPWLIEHGFIREVEERERIQVGSLWRHMNGAMYILNQSNLNEVALNNLEGINYTLLSTRVEDLTNLTDKEWGDVVGNTGKRFFTRVHGHLEFVEDK